MRVKRTYFAGRRVLCDLRGHCWTRNAAEDGQLVLVCRRCHLRRSGQPVADVEPQLRS
jgi:hypothetical protein